MAEQPTIAYAEKYSEIIDERFQQVSLTDAAANNEYDFDGVNSISIRSIATVPLNDYDMDAASNRYGTPQEIGSSLQNMKLTQDKSFTFTIDRRNNTDTMMTHSAGAAMDREIKEVIVPYVDRYRIAVLAKNAATIRVEDITPENAYTSFLTASRELFNKKVPTEGRIAFVSPDYYMCIKLDKNFTKNGDKGLDIAINGAVGKVDNTAIVVVPTEYLPLGVNFLITHPCAMVAPKKIADYKQHENPQGINGWLVEGRIYFDAFVLKNKRWAIYLSKANTYAATFTVTTGESTPVQGVEVYAGGRFASTDESGQAIIQLANGSHHYNVLAEGYEPVTGELTISGKAASQAVNLTESEGGAGYEA
ncbi:N4-gp56 family major capsid protein [Candidatus Allofournierella excrementavium]|uniref:N4-gp56 family major capsid protein n=1 Tax=Candidatus Allofournierella excrementavium TaxID=2838591 RepID=UPI003AF677A2